MIKVSNKFPSESTWNSTIHSYFEVYGETKPLLCKYLAQTISFDAKSDDNEVEVGIPIYEYFWTIGISDRLLEHFSKTRQGEKAAEVTLYFPLNGGWRVYEIVSTIRYLRPLPHHNKENLLAKVAEYWKTVSPVMDSVADVARNLPPPLSISSTILHLLAKLQVTSLPPIEGLEWSIKRINSFVGTEMMDGIQWRIPKEIFEVLGSRLTGSIAVFFLPMASSSDEEIEAKILPKAITAEAEIHFLGYHSQQTSETEKHSLELSISPSFKKQTATTIIPKTDSRLDTA